MFSLLSALALILPPSHHQPLQTPTTGTQVLERMHAAYAGKWYHALTFVQRTTRHPNDTTTTVATWYEAIRAPSSLRIDLDSATSGNGTIYTADSSYSVRAGKVTPRAGGNPFLPLIEGVYTQAIERTVRDMAQYKVDLSRIRADHWDGHPVWVVGAASPSDTTSPQFWVDTDRLVLLRMIVPFGDVHLGGYEHVGEGWLATRVEFYSGGVLRQLEEYRDWKADPSLSPDLFDPTKWSTAPHWAKK
jgi:hypothetical protein